MHKFAAAVSIFVGLLAAPLCAQEPARSPAAELSATDAIILGVVEGITEFLPISSTGHLIIANRALGLESEVPLVDENGQTLWHRKPSAENPRGEPLTVKLAAGTYAVVIQFGAIAAVAILYRRQIQSMLRGLIGRDMAGLRLLVSLGVAFVPAAVLGLLFHDFIDERLFSTGAVIVAQVIGAGLMLYAEWWRKSRKALVQRPVDTDRLGIGKAGIIGLFQCLALWPGMSRSMTAIVGGYFTGLDGRGAAEFSFLLGFVTLGAAAAYKSLQSGPAMIAVFGWQNVILGAVVAAISAAIAVRFLVSWLTHHGLAGFAIYRLVLAAALAAWLYL